MDEAARHGHSPRAGRLLAVLAVLLGILVMHGLVSAHHAPVAAAAAAHPAAAAPLHHAAAADPHQRVLDAASAQQPADPRSVPAGASCDGDCGAVVLLCLAVLVVTVGVAVALVVVRRRRATGADQGGTVPTPAGLRSAVPPPDLVRELCVSRT